MRISSSGVSRNTPMIRTMHARMFDQLAPLSGNDPAASIQGKSFQITPQIQLQEKPGILTNYARGPVGFLQWLAAVHPDIFADLKKKRPQLLSQALTQPANSVAGLASYQLGSWFTDVRDSLENKVSNIIGIQLQQAAAGQQPVNTATAPAIPPGATAVTTPGFGNMGIMIGIGAAAVIGGLVFLKRK